MQGSIVKDPAPEAYYDYEVAKNKMASADEEVYTEGAEEETTNNDKTPALEACSEGGEDKVANDAKGGLKVKVAAHAVDAVAPSCNSSNGGSPSSSSSLSSSSSSSKRTSVALASATGINDGESPKRLKRPTASR